ncbi:MAG: GNAT family N-acetyltransferase [Candidatus Thorarchaeota archaeon]
MIREIKDKAILYQRFKEDVYLFAYHIGDLDDFYFSNCTWFGLEENGQLKEVILLFRGLEIPTLLIFGSAEKIPFLIQQIIKELPDRFYCHYQEDFHNYFQSDYKMTFLGSHLKMKLQEEVATLTLFDTTDTILLNQDDEQEILSLYKTAYPESSFIPNMLKTGKYYGIKSENKIVSVAGVHVFSALYNIAVLGNITTNPNFRGRGLAKKCIIRLLKSFDGVVNQIGLNVKKDNDVALKLYQQLGFSIHSKYKEAYFERISGKI